MARLTESNMTKAERAAFARLQAAVGFASRVYFGRDHAVNGGLLQRVVEDGTHVLFALAVPDSAAQSKVREFRLLIAPVPATLGNGTQHAARPAKKRLSAAARAAISAGMKAMHAKRRAAQKAHAPTGD